MDKWSQAKCLKLDIAIDDPFFSDDEIDQEEATEYCNGTVDNFQCPIRNQCLKFALENHIEYGVYGGMTPVSRQAVLKKMPTKKNKPNPIWKWMTQEEALSNLSDKTITEMRRNLRAND